MRPLILIYLSIVVVYGSPGSFYYPTPTASAPPATVNNLPAPISAIAPSLLIENVPYSGQFGIPSVNRIGGKPQGLYQSQPQFNLPFGNLGWNFGQSRFSYVHPGFGFAQPGFNFVRPGYNFVQPELNFGGQFFNINSPQVAFGARPGIGINTAPLNLPPFRPTTPNLGPINIAPTRPTPDVGIGSVQGTVSTATTTTTRPSISLPEKNNVGKSPSGTVVHKYFYFHTPPIDQEEQPPRVIVPPPQKHIRIIFIKAPTTPKPVVIVPQQEEKTIIYVLTKKQEAQPEINIQAPATSLPSKPEVHFIRYDAPKQNVTNADAPNGKVATDEALEDRPSVTEGLTYDIDTRFNPDAVDDNNKNSLKDVAQDLNIASLTGGSALSLAVTSATNENAPLISSTPATSYGSAFEYN